MDLTASQKRSSVWEINYRGRISLASRLVKEIFDDEVKKQQLKVNIAERPEQLKCGFCDTPVHFSEHLKLGLYFKHRTAVKDEDIRKLHSSCPFFTGDDRHPLLAQIYSGEGRWHFETKHLIASILENDTLCKRDSVQVERYIINHDEDTRRRPDVYFEDQQDGKWAIELTNHWMNPTIAVERSNFFRNNDINVIWLLSPKCHLNQDSMFRFTLFGLSGKPNTTSEISSHFNGYVMDDDAITFSKQESKLNIKALLPTFYINRSENKVDYNVEEEIVHFSELHKDSESNVPYLVHKGINYQKARDELEAHKANERELQLEREYAERKMCEKEIRIKVAEEEFLYERNKLKLANEKKAKELDNAEIGYDKFCNELIANIKNMLEINFDNLPIFEAIKKSDEMRLYLEDKVGIIRSLNAKYNFFNEQVLRSLSSLREHVEYLVNHYGSIMANEQHAIIQSQLDRINYLSESFDYSYAYKPILSLALNMFENIPNRLHESFHHEYWTQISFKIRRFSTAVSKEVDSIIKESLKHAPIPSHITKVIGAHNMLIKTDFANLNHVHMNNIEQLKLLYERISHSNFSEC
jgi:hypothetical protein